MSNSGTAPADSVEDEGVACRMHAIRTPGAGFVMVHAFGLGRCGRPERVRKAAASVRTVDRLK